MYDACSQTHEIGVSFENNSNDLNSLLGESTERKWFGNNAIL